MSRSLKNPILANLYHGDHIESRHRGCIIVMDKEKGILHASGDPDQIVCLRSALKPLQALMLVVEESANNDDYRYCAEELAIACGSHDGEHFHVKTVRHWLQRLGFSESDLNCGAGFLTAEFPKEESAKKEIAKEEIDKQGIVRETLLKNRVTITNAFNGCSGKHTGFLAVSKRNGWSINGYCEVNHPLQKAIMALISVRAEIDPQNISINCDYCNAPNLFMPFRHFARAFASLINDETGGAQVIEAMMQCPEMVGGTSQFATRCMLALPGRVAAKSGAEGVMLSIIPEKGLVVLVKADDGADRAAEVATAQLLDELGMLDDASRTALKSDLNRPMRSSTGDIIGRLLPVTPLMPSKA